MISPISGAVCVGKKGRSGRKSTRIENTKNRTIEKSWEITSQNLDKSSALQIALKDMTVKEEHKVIGEILTIDPKTKAEIDLFIKSTKGKI